MEKTATCVLIDDDLDEHIIFGMALSDTLLPVSCSYFPTWEMAKETLDNKAIYAPDFIFIDWYLGSFQISDIINGIKQISKLYSSQLVIYSGIEQPETISNTFTNHSYKFLHKTGSISQLTQELKTLLSS